MQTPIVLLDACTLYPAAQRDVFMRLALHGLIHARWTDEIHDEWIQAVLRNRSDLSKAKLERTRGLMDLHAEGSLVHDYQRHMEALALPDPNDRHVLAAAIEAKATILLTWNLSDFPDEILRAHRITTQTPDALMVDLFETQQDQILAVLREARNCLKNPPLSGLVYLDTLQRQGLVRSVALLEPFAGCI